MKSKSYFQKDDKKYQCKLETRKVVILCFKDFLWDNCFQNQLVIGPPSYGGPFKIICLSVRQFGIFLKNGPLVFSDFWHDGR